MRDLSAVARQLRATRRAQLKFLGLWAVEQALVLPALDRVAADVAGNDRESETENIFSMLDDEWPAADE
jgi:predicted component of type VI protein secretion system